jgi:hypothetical protein
VQPQDVTLPPYYPRDPVLLRDWAAYLDAVRFTDKHVGQVLARLEQEGILENTLVVFMTDHGISHARGKQFLYNEGTHVPFVVRGPGVSKGAVREDLIEQIDLAALTLAAAGVPISNTMHARDVLARDYKTREAVFAGRDRCDETVERIRSVRTDRFLYIRNSHPQRPHLQPNAYKDGKSIVQALRTLHAAGALDPLSETLLFAPSRSAEELYEWKVDRWQVQNLATEPVHRQTLETLRARLDRWMDETNDHGPESEKMYDSDMVEYLVRGNPAVEKNIAVVEFFHHIAIQSSRGSAFKPLRSIEGQMRHRVAEVEKKWFVAMLFDVPQCFLRVEVSHFRRDRRALFNGITAQHGHASLVIKKDCLPMVEVMQHAVVGVEPLVQRPHAGHKAEVPFADATCGIAGLLKNLSERDFPGRKSLLRIGPQHTRGQADSAWVLSGHQRRPRRRAKRGGDRKVGEPCSLGGHAIKTGRLNVFRAVTT